jgi:hypothetical protein
MAVEEESATSSLLRMALSSELQNDRCQLQVDQIRLRSRLLVNRIMLLWKELNQLESMPTVCQLESLDSF